MDLCNPRVAFACGGLHPRLHSGDPSGSQERSRLDANEFIAGKVTKHLENLTQRCYCCRSRTGVRRPRLKRDCLAPHADFVSVVSDRPGADARWVWLSRTRQARPTTRTRLVKRWATNIAGILVATTCGLGPRSPTVSADPDAGDTKRRGCFRASNDRLGGTSIRSPVDHDKASRPPSGLGAPIAYLCQVQL